jgi:hypothetical protein
LKCQTIHQFVGMFYIIYIDQYIWSVHGITYMIYCNWYLSYLFVNILSNEIDFIWSIWKILFQRLHIFQKVALEYHRFSLHYEMQLWRTWYHLYRINQFI